MTRHHQRPTGIRSLVPALARWSSFRGAFLNLLVFGTAALGAMWVVHQTEYAIEYGGRFGAVMHDTPHRLYIWPLGMVLGLALLLFALGVSAVLRRAGAERRAIVLGLPPRLRQCVRIAQELPDVPVVARTAGVLAACQTVLYVLQENLERVAITGVWPGMSVLTSPRHLTVIPLHLLAAAVTSFLLWLVAACFHRSDRATAMARLLQSLAGRGHRPAPSVPAPDAGVPSSRLDNGARCPRAPPLAA